ncbi:UNKNOWN [Stylonychia lemnae]|uniref:Transmembrane protein n=1 Tax=Stylonychia lemnae TaxID=5949 RepID=A0A078AY65_STYLE|nr:UNKNOWN [Stylonychia lemnae]|eukprot:CDW85733.1 UNKNOWN [Stylonychia lemnae]
MTPSPSRSQEIFEDNQSFLTSSDQEIYDYHSDQSNLCVEYLLTKAFDRKYQDEDGLFDNLLTLGVSIFIYPFCLLKEFHKIRVKLTSQIIIQSDHWKFHLFDDWYENKVESDFFKKTSLMNSVPEFCFTFHFEIFFLIVHQYTRVKRRIQNAKIVSITTNLIILGYSVAYSVLCLSSSIVFKDFRETVDDTNETVKANGYLVNGMIVVVTLLQIPFKFFVSKEFLFIMYDELRNCGLSNKVDQMQKKVYGNLGYTQQSIRQISAQHYQIVREPYLKLSKKEYYILTTSIFLIDCVLVGILKSDLRDQYGGSGRFIQYMTNVTSAIIQPLVVYCCSGYFYYKACLKFEIKQVSNSDFIQLFSKKMRLFALGFAYLGLVLAIYYTFIVVFNISSDGHGSLEPI